VVVVSRNGYLWAWKTKGRADQNVQWESFHHDLQNSGDFATKEIVRKGPVASSGKSGCSEAGVELLPLSGLALLALPRRRKRSRRPGECARRSGA